MLHRGRWWCGALTVTLGVAAQSVKLEQPHVGSRSAPVLLVEGLRFKDLDRNGKLEPYEDWRLSPEARADDLAGRMSLEELAGLMVHGTLPSSGALAALGMGQRYDLARVQQMLEQQHVSSFITRLNATPSMFAHENNAVQALAEMTHWGIPVTISSDPRHHLGEVLGANVAAGGFSVWPGPLGFAALNDAALTKRFGDAVRREYMAVGIRESLAPQADLVTEPRWARADGTFGADAKVAKAMVEAYVAGVQNGEAGLNKGSVMAVVKHWAGYGAQKDGWDSHNYYGRFATYPGDNFAEHLVPFEGAFAAHVAAVMPTYSIPEGLTIEGRPAEPVGAGFSRQMLTELLRGRYGFQGLVLSDWAITNDCNAGCREGLSAVDKPGPGDIGMPWGVMELTEEQRFAKAINAGVDQMGGTEQSGKIVQAVRDGLIPEQRVQEAARKVLVQKFALGLFEDPYVNEAQAAGVVGSAPLVRQGQRAQAAATVLLKNEASRLGRPTLPLHAAGKRVYLYGIKADEARMRGLEVVDDPAQADVAILRVPAAHATQHPKFFFGSRQHEGRLNFTEDDPGYARLLEISEQIPTIFVTTLERPLILTEVMPHAVAVLGDFGIADGVLLDLVLGRYEPRGKLPFALPRSVASVEAQKSDVPNDEADPLFAVGFGLEYPRRR